MRVGYYGHITEQIQVGASYSSKIGMDNFDKYQGLFAAVRRVRHPSNWSLGVAFKPTPAWLLALDYERINYSDVDSVHNRSNLILQCPPPPASPTSNCLGGSNGAGFGWQSVNVWRLGVQYQIDPQWTVRAGYNHSDNPIQPQDVTFNILAPGVIKDHATLGATWTWDRQNEITGAFMYAFQNSVTGASLFNSFFPPGMQRTCRRRSRCTSGRSACSTHGGSDAAAYSPRPPSARSFASQRSRLAALASTVPIRVSLIGPMPTKPRMFRSRLLRLCARKNQR